MSEMYTTKQNDDNIRLNSSRVLSLWHFNVFSLNSFFFDPLRSNNNYRVIKSLHVLHSFISSFDPAVDDENFSSGVDGVVAVELSGLRDLDAARVAAASWLTNWEMLFTLFSFFHFILRFWNQILICLSVRPRAWAISIRRLLVKYRLKWNSFSSSSVWYLVYAVRERLVGSWLLWWPKRIRRKRKKGNKVNVEITVCRRNQSRQWIDWQWHRILSK